MIDFVCSEVLRFRSDRSPGGPLILSEFVRMRAQARLFASLRVGYDVLRRSYKFGTLVYGAGDPQPVRIRAYTRNYDITYMQYTHTHIYRYTWHTYTVQTPTHTHIGTHTHTHTVTRARAARGRPKLGLNKCIRALPAGFRHEQDLAAFPSSKPSSHW